jgi:hypothetical protein
MRTPISVARHFFLPFVASSQIIRALTEGSISLEITEFSRSDEKRKEKKRKEKEKTVER